MEKKKIQKHFCLGDFIFVLSKKTREDSKKTFVAKTLGYIRGKKIEADVEYYDVVSVTNQLGELLQAKDFEYIPVASVKQALYETEVDVPPDIYHSFVNLYNAYQYRHFEISELIENITSE